MDIPATITKELGIPNHYLKIYESRKNRLLAIVHREWISSLLAKNEIPEFISHDILVGEEIQTLFYEKQDLLSPWCKILIQIVIKPNDNELIIPLPRPRMGHSNNEAELSFAQLLHYVQDTNFKNIWKHFYKKYIGETIINKSKDYHKGNLLKISNGVLVEIIKRFYGCKIILGKNFNKNSYSSHTSQIDFEPHPNILPALCAVETEGSFVVLHYLGQLVSLKDCITYSPTLLNSNYSKALFVIYQLLQVMKNLHDRGLLFGNVQLSDIFLNDTLFIQIIPDLQENVCKLSGVNSEIPLFYKEHSFKVEIIQRSFSLGRPYPVFPSLPKDSNLQLICSKWMDKQISNFDYLMYLNHIAGRRFGDPSCHFIMPWVTDFATRTSGNWRDLSKSKFRLNKGDKQLDLTYENAVNSSQTPHHVSDVLSEITYFVYLSRRTPQILLCKYVRSVWVPAEYPSSIQRLQEWTPDECIPEFFYDPAIFKSIHEDLPDLELPHWALTPEEFIEAHRECLESKYVSERLHHWIDLTFGYKLSGSAAIKSKNVCLHLVESHRELKTSGVVQLFSYPHPPRYIQNQFFEKVPPKALLCLSHRQSKIPTAHSDKGTAGSEDEGHSSGNGEDDSYCTKNSPLILSKLISRSKGSLLAPFQSSSDETTRHEPTKLCSLGGQTLNTSTNITLPKEFVPSGLLSSIEANQNFFRKTFLMRENVTPAMEKKDKMNAKQIVANKRLQEMHVLGCLIVEMFLYSKIRVLDISDLDNRLKTCSGFLNSDSLPRCVRLALDLLLQPLKNHQNFPYITMSGLPPPSAHQFLQPLLTSFMFPFPNLLPVIYASVCNLISCSRAVTKYQLWNSQSSDLSDKLNILRVKKFSIDLEKIWDDILSFKNSDIIGLLFPFIKELFENPSTSRLSVILFLDKVCRSLGPKQTNELLLETIINLYNSNLYDSTESLYFYHKNFLLVLIVRCGLKVFLENFIGPLMEAVGRFKDRLNDSWDVNAYSDMQDISSNVEDKVTNTKEGSSSGLEDNDVGIFSFDKDDPSCNLEDDETVRLSTDYLDLNIPSDQFSQDEDISFTHVQSSEIPIPGSSIRPNSENVDACGTEDKHLESRKTPQCVDKQQKRQKNSNFFDVLDFYPDNVDLSQIKASDIAGDSIVWLSHRLGPVLTSRYLTRNLLRVLSLCYTGKDNLEPYKFTIADESNLWKLSVLKWKVVGDDNVETVLKVLGEISELYGEQIILLQYLPFMSELINLSKKKFTLSLEGGIIGCLSLLKYIIPFMNDSTLMDQLQDVILKTIIHPTVRLVSSTRFVFPSGHRGRYTLVSKLIDCIYVISLRIGTEMTKVHITVPALQRYFLAFDKAHGDSNNRETDVSDRENIEHSSNNPARSLDDNRYLEIQRDGSTTEWSVRGVPGEPVSFAHVTSHESLDSSPCDPSNVQQNETFQNKAMTELKSVFDARLAHLCYTAFCRFLGETVMENTLKNHNFIRDLCYQHEQEQYAFSQRGKVSSQTFVSDIGCGQDSNIEKENAGSFGSNVAVIGNKIEIQTVNVDGPLAGFNNLTDSCTTTLICRKKEDSGRHLRGNWLAYWEHEIGRSDKDNKFNFKQIKLQGFVGHGNSVRMIHCLENENSFMSGSKDKTVKLWSLRSQGDGSGSYGCQFTYAHHRKSLLSLSFIHPVRLVASCDSTIHLWDPFEGKTISVMDNAKVAPINVIKPLNPPSCNLIAATTDATLKIMDSRLCSFISEFKISVSSVGLIRSICVSPNGYWVAVGQASGLLTVLDVRTGMVLSSWKGHEAEVLQLVAVTDNILMSSSLDQTVSVWNVSDGKFKFHMKGPAEPVHCLAVYNSELISGTTANRIGVHSTIDSQASFSSTKLRSDTFKGILTSMTILPLNKLLLLGADNGNITLLC